MNGIESPTIRRHHELDHERLHQQARKQQAQQVECDVTLIRADQVVGREQAAAAHAGDLDDRRQRDVRKAGDRTRGQEDHHHGRDPKHRCSLRSHTSVIPSRGSASTAFAKTFLRYPSRDPIREESACPARSSRIEFQPRMPTAPRGSGGRCSAEEFADSGMPGGARSHGPDGEGEWSWSGPADIYQVDGRSGHPNFYFATDDINASIAKVRELGGRAGDRRRCPGTAGLRAARQRVQRVSPVAAGRVGGLSGHRPDGNRRLHLRGARARPGERPRRSPRRSGCAT